eukprot:7376750-Prymnesium_polylepis.2
MLPPDGVQNVHLELGQVICAEDTLQLIERTCVEQRQLRLQVGNQAARFVPVKPTVGNVEHNDGDPMAHRLVELQQAPRPCEHTFGGE